MHRNVHLHFTPTYSSWLNQVFGTEDGTFDHVRREPGRKGRSVRRVDQPLDLSLGGKRCEDRGRPDRAIGLT